MGVPIGLRRKMPPPPAISGPQSASSGPWPAISGLRSATSGPQPAVSRPAISRLGPAISRLLPVILRLLPGHGRTRPSKGLLESAIAVRHFGSPLPGRDRLFLAQGRLCLGQDRLFPGRGRTRSFERPPRTWCRRNTVWCTVRMRHCPQGSRGLGSCRAAAEGGGTTDPAGSGPAGWGGGQSEWARRLIGSESAPVEWEGWGREGEPGGEEGREDGGGCAARGRSAHRNIWFDDIVPHLLICVYREHPRHDCAARGAGHDRGQGAALHQGEHHTHVIHGQRAYVGAG